MRKTGPYMPPSGILLPARIFKTRYFSRWMRRAGLEDQALLTAIDEMSAGLVDADLGGGVVKKRIPVPGRGKRGGARTLLATNRDSRWIFMVGYMKSEQEDIGEDELKNLRIYAADLLSLSEEQLGLSLASSNLEEIFRECEA